MTILKGILILIFGVWLFALLTALPVFLLWNWLMPEIFGVKTISLLQALGLNFLCGILLRSYRSDYKSSSRH